MGSLVASVATPVKVNGVFSGIFAPLLFIAVITGKVFPLLVMAAQVPPVPAA